MAMQGSKSFLARGEGINAFHNINRVALNRFPHHSCTPPCPLRPWCVMRT